MVVNCRVRAALGIQGQQPPSTISARFSPIMFPPFPFTPVQPPCCPRPSLPSLPEQSNAPYRSARSLATWIRAPARHTSAADSPMQWSTRGDWPCSNVSGKRVCMGPTYTHLIMHMSMTKLFFACFDG